MTVRQENQGRFTAAPIEVAARLSQQFKTDDYAGYDPFDGLNSKRFQSLPFSSQPYVRLAWLQLHKRLLFNMRPLLAVKKQRNPKAIALVILGLLSDFRRSGEQVLLNEAVDLGHWLLDNQSAVQSEVHCCWGYHFDWQARAFSVPKGKPNIISTSYVSKALGQLFTQTQIHAFQKASTAAAQFIVDVLYTEAGGRRFFAYIPGETTFVHNASLWGGATVARHLTHGLTGQAKAKVINATAQSCQEQMANGSWVYGGNSHHQFIDAFHTGYNIEALSEINEILQQEPIELAVERAFEYYKATFIAADGCVKYYSDALYPLDTHNFAQAIITLTKMGNDQADFLICNEIIESLMSKMYLPKKGRFAYQRGRFLTNSVNYMRWSQAWAYYALSYYSEKHANAEN